MLTEPYKLPPRDNASHSVLLMVWEQPVWCVIMIICTDIHITLAADLEMNATTGTFQWRSARLEYLQCVSTFPSIEWLSLANTVHDMKSN